MEKLRRNFFYLTTGSQILASAGRFRPTRFSGEEAAGIRETDAGGGLCHRPSAAKQASRSCRGSSTIASGGGRWRVLEKNLKKRGHVFRFIASVKIRHFSSTIRSHNKTHQEIKKDLERELIINQDSNFLWPFSFYDSTSKTHFSTIARAHSHTHTLSLSVDSFLQYFCLILKHDGSNW